MAASRGLLGLLLALVLGQALWLAFSNLDERPFSRRSEARTAVAAREMMAGDDFVIPRVNGQPRLQKPPLYYWQIIAADDGDGRVSHREARLPSVVNALLLVVLVAGFAYRLPRGNGAAAPTERLMTALLAAAVLVTMPGFFVKMRNAEAESLLAVSVFAVVMVLSRRLRRLDRGSLPAAFLLSGAGFLAKGPIILAFAWPAYLLVRGRAVLAEFPALLAGLALMAVVASPWFIAVILRVGGIDVFLSELAMRFGDTAPHQAPWHYYFTELFSSAFPWSVLLPFALYTAWCRRNEPALAQLFWTVVLGFAFLTVLQTKQTHYLMPLYAPAAVLVTEYLRDSGFDEQSTRNRMAWFLTLAIQLMLLVAIAALFAMAVLEEDWPLLGRTGIWMSVGLVLLGSARVRRPPWLAAWSAGAVVIVLWFLVAYLVPVNRLKEDQAPFIAGLAPTVEAGKLHANFTDERVVYYLGRPLPELAVGGPGPGTGYRGLLLSEGEGLPAGIPLQIVARDNGFVSSGLILSRPAPVAGTPLLDREPIELPLVAPPAPSATGIDRYAADGLLAVRLGLPADLDLRAFIARLQAAAQTFGAHQAAWKLLVLDYAPRDDSLRARWRGLYQPLLVEALLKKAAIDLMLVAGGPDRIGVRPGDRIDIDADTLQGCRARALAGNDTLSLEVDGCSAAPAAPRRFRRSVDRAGTPIEELAQPALSAPPAA